VAAAVILHHGRVLLICRKRPEGELSWQFPAGRIEPGETPEKAAVREAKEETGLHTAAVLLLGERIHPGTGRPLAYIACHYLAGTAHIAAPEEIADTAWAPVPDLPRYIPGGVFGPVRAYLAPGSRTAAAAAR
jgi:8-oxo-dGTP diphosphatase